MSSMVEFAEQNGLKTRLFVEKNFPFRKFPAKVKDFRDMTHESCFPLRTKAETQGEYRVENQALLS